MRIRETYGKRDYESVIDDYITLGYRTVSRGERTTKVKKSEYGGVFAHILIFIFTIWWTFGLANILYFLFKYLTGEEVLIRYRDADV